MKDVSDQGIPIERFSVKDSQNRTIAAYRFGDPSKVRNDTLGGRKGFSKAFKQSLIERYGCQCNICLTEYEARYLQIDRRVPYEVAGDSYETERDSGEYMLLCRSCNRAKSWSCEHCINWLEEQSADVCNSCYWGRPESYKHIALRSIRRLEIVWTEEEVEIYEQLQQRAKATDLSMPDYVKSIIENYVQ